MLVFFYYHYTFLNHIIKLREICELQNSKPICVAPKERLERVFETLIMKVRVCLM